MVAGDQAVRPSGLRPIGAAFRLHVVAYNLIRLANLLSLLKVVE
jgi:hypothetical protein